jgi:7-keto-8-aminopelargonate synthetase-like enzyme
MKKTKSFYSNYLSKLKFNDLYRSLVNLDNSDTKEIYYQNKKYINFCSNDYLGLRKNNDLILNATSWLKKYGSGLGSSRLVTGSLFDINKIEKKNCLLEKG